MNEVNTFNKMTKENSVQRRAREFALKNKPSVSFCPFCGSKSIYELKQNNTLFLCSSCHIDFGVLNRG
jgi:hypothetical protein